MKLSRRKLKQLIYEALDQDQYQKLKSLIYSDDIELVIVGMNILSTFLDNSTGSNIDQKLYGLYNEIGDLYNNKRTKLQNEIRELKVLLNFYRKKENKYVQMIGDYQRELGLQSRSDFMKTSYDMLSPHQKKYYDLWNEARRDYKYNFEIISDVELQIEEKELQLSKFIQVYNDVFNAGAFRMSSDDGTSSVYIQDPVMEIKITKKKLIRLIRESINTPKNPDNTLEKIFLREVHYRLNYLTSFIDQFDFLIQQTAVACNDYDDDLSDKIEKLRSDYDNGYGDRLKLNSQIEILSEIKEKVTRPCTRSCGSLRGATEYFGYFFGYIYEYLIFESANNLGMKKDSASFEFANSGKNDGKEDLISIIKNNYNSSNTEKVDIIQYIIDTWNDTEWIIGNMDPEAKSVLEANGISNISTYDKIDTLIILLKDAGIIGQKMQDRCFELTGVKSLETQLLNDLNKIDGQIKNKLPNHKAKYENDIEEFLYILREERNYSFRNIMDIITDPDQSNDDYKGTGIIW